MTFDTAVNAFGFNWFDFDNTDSYRLEVAGTNFEDPPFRSTGTGSAFFGVVSDTAFNSVTFRSTQANGVVDLFGIDNVRVSAVPVPMGLAMILSALGLAGVVRRLQASA